MIYYKFLKLKVSETPQNSLGRCLGAGAGGRRETAHRKAPTSNQTAGGGNDDPGQGKGRTRGKMGRRSQQTQFHQSG